jgi:hypothetical protein
LNVISSNYILGSPDQYFRGEQLKTLISSLPTVTTRCQQPAEVTSDQALLSVRSSEFHRVGQEPLLVCGGQKGFLRDKLHAGQRHTWGSGPTPTGFALPAKIAVENYLAG